MGVFFKTGMFVFLLIFSRSIFSQEAQESTFELGVENGRQQIRENDRREKIINELDQSVDVRLDAEGLTQFDQVIPNNESPCFIINDVILVGDYSEKFQWLLNDVYAIPESIGSPENDVNAEIHAPSDILGRCLGVIGINVIIRQLQNALVERGYVTTRIVVGPQDLNDESLTLTLVAGKIKNIHFSDKKVRTNILPMQSGDLLNLRDIEQALESLRRLPSVNTDIQIIPSQGDDAKPGESDLLVVWEQNDRARLVTSVDNSGTKNTGFYQGNLSLAYDNLLGLHDIFTASISHDIGGGDVLEGGTESYSLGYVVPYEYWTVNFGLSQSEFFQTVQGAFQQFQFSGESRNANISFNRLLHRNSVRKLNAGINAWFRDSKNFVNDAEIVPQRRRTGGLELSIDYREFIGSTTLSGAITYRKGTGAFGSLRAPEESFDEGTSRPDIIRSNLQLNTSFSLIDRSFFYSGLWRHQHNRDRLTSQDRFSIGGRFSVRGFDGERTLSSDRGWLIRNDISTPIGNGKQSVYFGIDYGQVGGTPSQALIGNHLSGAAMGIQGNVAGFNYDIFWGHPLNKPDGFISESFITQFSIRKAF